jgi:hypothetical protein
MRELHPSDLEADLERTLYLLRMHHVDLEEDPESIHYLQKLRELHDDRVEDLGSIHCLKNLRELHVDLEDDLENNLDLDPNLDVELDANIQLNNLHVPPNNDPLLGDHLDWIHSMLECTSATMSCRKQSTQCTCKKDTRLEAIPIRK